MLEHPYGVAPWGNFLMAGGPNIRDASLGDLHVLSDELLLAVLALLRARELGHVAVTSRALYAFAGAEELWKDLLLNALEPKCGASFTWQGTWKESYLASIGLGHQHPCYKGRVRVTGLYSDLLYQPFFCASTELSPRWLEVDNVPRCNGLSVAEFRARFEAPNRPVILTDVVTQWPAMNKWSLEYLAGAYAGQPATIGNQPLPFDEYLKYCASNNDDQPLYLFDSAFVTKVPSLAQDYEVPSHFGDEDLFQVLGDMRPDYRWLIVGPSRSGSSFHVDPNATSAWNAVLCGSKKWVLFPPDAVPPGVHPSPDGADVATPVSLVEWFWGFYEEARESKTPPLECTLRAGELLFVPRGWWHLALNLEVTVAITHNFVSSANLPHVLRFLQQPNAEALVSGCDRYMRSSLHDRFVMALAEQRPDVLAWARAWQAEQEHKREQQQHLAELFRSADAACALRGREAQERQQAKHTSGLGWLRKRRMGLVRGFTPGLDPTEPTGNLLHSTSKRARNGPAAPARLPPQSPRSTCSTPSSHQAPPAPHVGDHPETGSDFKSLYRRLQQLNRRLGSSIPNPRSGQQSPPDGSVVPPACMCEAAGDDMSDRSTSFRSWLSTTMGRELSAKELELASSSFSHWLTGYTPEQLDALHQQYGMGSDVDEDEREGEDREEDVGEDDIVGVGKPQDGADPPQGSAALEQRHASTFAFNFQL